MQIEPIRLLDGAAGRDFVRYDESGTELFSARLMDGGTELVVGWTANVPWTVLWLRDVQRLERVAVGCSGGYQPEALARQEASLANASG
jgi:hypothetical protein